MIRCQHNTSDHPRRVTCTLPEAVAVTGERPHVGVCMECEHYDGPMRGAGDLIAMATRKVGLRSCNGCKKRQQYLNRVLPRSKQ